MKLNPKGLALQRKADNKDAANFVRHAKSTNNTVTPVGSGLVELYHSQDVKLSLNYQSASCTFGVKLIVADNEEAIRKGIKRAVGLVEAPLYLKVKEQHELLKEISTAVR